MVDKNTLSGMSFHDTLIYSCIETLCLQTVCMESKNKQAILKCNNNASLSDVSIQEQLTISSRSSIWNTHVLAAVTEGD